MASVRVVPLCFLAVALLQVHFSTATAIPESVELKADLVKEGAGDKAVATEEQNEAEGSKELKDEDVSFLDLDDFVLPEISVNVKVTLPKKKNHHKSSSKPEVVEFFEEVPEEPKTEVEQEKSGNEKSVVNNNNNKNGETSAALKTRGLEAPKSQGTVSM